MDRIHLSIDRIDVSMNKIDVGIHGSIVVGIAEGQIDVVYEYL